MKVGCSSWSFHRTFAKKELTFKEWIRLCAEHYRLTCRSFGTSFESDEPEYLWRSRLCVRTWSDNLLLWQNNYRSQPEELDREIEHVKGFVDVASILARHW